MLSVGAEAILTEDVGNDDAFSVQDLGCVEVMANEFHRIGVLTQAMIVQIGVGKLFADLFGYAGAHDAMAVNLVNDDVYIRFKKITFDDLDRVISPSIRFSG